MAWIPLYDTVREHRKTYAAACILKTSNAHIVGLLGCLWAWAATYATDGDLTPYPIKAIASAAGWDKDPNKFIEAMVNSRWIDRINGRIILHDWVDHCEMLIVAKESEKEATRRRVQNYRAKKKIIAESQYNEETEYGNRYKAVTCNDDVTVTSNKKCIGENNGCNAAIVPNLIVPYQNVITTERALEAEPDDFPEEMRDEGFASVIQHYGQEMGREPTPGQVEELAGWLDTFTPEMLRMAIDEAVRQDARKMAYVQGILRGWMADGIDSPENVRRLREEYEKRKRSAAEAAKVREKEKLAGFRKTFKDPAKSFQQREYDTKQVDSAILNEFLNSDIFKGVEDNIGGDKGDI